MNDERIALLAEVLPAHRGPSVMEWGYICDCGNHADRMEGHYAHVAAVLAAALAAASPDTAAPAEVASGAEGAALTDSAEQIVRDRMAYYGYTPEQITAAEGTTHESVGCVVEHPYGWICTDEDDKPLHPDRDELDRTVEFVMWVLKHPHLARRGVADRAKLGRVADEIEAMSGDSSERLSEFEDGYSEGTKDAARILRAALATDTTPDTPQPTPALWPTAGQAWMAGEYPGRDGGGA